MPDRPRLLYLSGQPGIGKSTLMAELTAHLRRLPLPPDDGAPARALLIRRLSDGNPWIQAVEIGRRRDSFSGTDALPQTVIDVAERYVRTGRALSETRLLLAEGARLACRRFLTAAADSGWAVTLIHLTGDDTAAERRAARAVLLGKPEQNPGWVKGRITAARNLAAQAPDWGVRVITLDANRPVADLAQDVRNALTPPVGSP